MVRARIRVDGRLAGGLQALLGGADGGLQRTFTSKMHNMPGTPKKGRLSRTALSAGYSFLLWGYPMDG